jgi:hypothetical protein
MNRIVFAAAAILAATAAQAADMALKAPPQPYAYPAGNGWYGIVGTEGGGGNASVNAPGVNQASLVTNSIDVHAGVGFAWNVPNSPMFSALEGTVGYTDFNGSVPGLSFQGPFVGSVRWLIGAPIDQILALFPTFGTMPTFQSLPSGFTIKSTKYYFALGADVRDDSLAFMGVSGSKNVWGIAPTVTPIGVMNQLTNGSAIDIYSKVSLNDRGLCTTAPGIGQACGRPKMELMAGIDYKFGIGGVTLK